MCVWGTHTECYVQMPDHLAWSGKAYWSMKHIDSCLADLINGLNALGIRTANCCCGHGDPDCIEGWVALHTGEDLTVEQAWNLYLKKAGL